MSQPPDDDDPARDWPEDAATLIELLPDELAEIEREETTPPWAPSSPIDYERGRRAGTREERERVLAAVGAILLAKHSVGEREVAQFLDLVREKLALTRAAPAPRPSRPP